MLIILSLLFLGTMIFSNSFYLTNVLYIPCFSFNLISVSKLTTSLNYKLTFSALTCQIQDMDTMKIIGVAELRNGLYTLDPTSFIVHKHVTVPTQLSYVNSASYTSSHLWHFRLGHPSSQKMHALHSKFPFIPCIDNKDPCKPCIMAKQKRLPFTVSVTKSVHTFDLIHIDIWGPISIPSSFGHRYFLTIFHDKSRFT